MTVKKFTEEEIVLLSENQYTMSVTKNTISFTTAFKELFWEDYSAGMNVSQIVKKYGYDPKVLGQSRLDGLTYTIKKAALEGCSFSNLTRPLSATENVNKSRGVSQVELKRLEKKMTYLEQEIEYLKKISLVRYSKK
ncbi:MAG: hypothetical protein RSC95_04060 [Anaerovoracaceae bacterium]